MHGCLPGSVSIMIRLSGTMVLKLSDYGDAFGAFENCTVWMGRIKGRHKFEAVVAVKTLTLVFDVVIAAALPKPWIPTGCLRLIWRGKAGATRAVLPFRA